MTDTTITLTHKGKTYERQGANPSECDGCAFFDEPVSHPVCKMNEHLCAGFIWVEQPQQESPLDMSGSIASVPQPRADVRSSDGWVKWDGGEMPVTGMVEVRYRNGVTNTDDADSFLWDHSDCPDDIVAYRIAIPAPQYDPRDVSFSPLDKQVGGNHYRDNSAPGFLREAISVMEQRGQQYDTEGGERSFAAAADTFNAITGYEITAADVALVQVCIKLVRSQSREEPHRDSLHAEERMKEGA